MACALVFNANAQTSYTATRHIDGTTTITEQPDPVSIGNFYGANMSPAIPQAPPVDVAAQARTRQALAQQDAVYAALQVERKPEMQNKVMRFRLQQATNGSTTYRLMVSTNYMKGTDGFPVNTNLAKYWYQRSQE